MEEQEQENMRTLEQKVDTLMRYCIAESEQMRRHYHVDLQEMLGVAGKSNLRKTVDRALSDLGIPDHLLGYAYLQTAISLVVEAPEGALAERDLATVRGRIVLNSANELSGELHYGIPKVLARVEYPDGQPDPIFQQQGEWAVLSTNLRGYGNMPGDDMAEVEARAAIARRDRPARIPFDQIDVNRMVEQLPQMTTPEQNAQNVQTAPSAPLTQPEVIDQSVQQPAPLYSPLEDTPNPFETSEDPFGPSSTPF
jgi:hypothetical protein